MVRQWPSLEISGEDQQGRRDDGVYKHDCHPESQVLPPNHELPRVGVRVYLECLIMVDEVAGVDWWCMVREVRVRRMG